MRSAGHPARPGPPLERAGPGDLAMRAMSAGPRSNSSWAPSSCSIPDPGSISTAPNGCSPSGSQCSPAAATTAAAAAGCRRCLAAGRPEVRTDLAALREAAHRLGAGTVNDALLTAVAGALSSQLRRRGESVETLVLAVMITAQVPDGRPVAVVTRPPTDDLPETPVPTSEVRPSRRCRRSTGAPEDGSRWGSPARPGAPHQRSCVG